MKTFLMASTAAAILGLAASPAFAQCEIEGEGSVRILGNDFDALSTIIDEVRDCQSDAVDVSVNLTTEHKAIQVPALTVDPAQYTVALVASNSIVPLMNEGLIRPLDDLVEQYGDQLQESQLIRLNGQIMGIAFMANSQHLFMRGDILEEAGLEPPTSYEEILAAAEAIREQGIMEYPLAATDQGGWYLATEFVNTYLGMGGEFFEPGSAEPAVNGEIGLKTLELMKKMTEYMGPEYMTYSSDEIKNIYLSGETAIMNQWGSMVEAHVGEDSGSPEISEATLLAPAPTVGGDIPAAALWWDGFAIAENISEEDAAVSFQAMMYGIRPEMAQNNPNAAAWLIKGYEPTQNTANVLATAEGGARPYPMTPYMGFMHTALGEELADFMQGSESAEQALADVEAAYRTAARQAGFLQ